MTYSTKRVTNRQIHTTDQKLLQEIRDDLWALPLAAQVSRGDLDTVKRLRAELDELTEQVAYQRSLITLLTRLSGLHPEKLSDDELALLTDVEALDGEPVQS